MTPQKYRYTGPYAEFRGYVFANRKAVTITDRGTLEAIKRRPDFEEVQDEEKAQAAPEVLTDACPKCGRVIKQGRYMHVKWCKGE